MDPEIIIGAASLLGLSIIISCCWRLMRTLRTRSSSVLFFSLCSLVLWSVLSDSVYLIVIYRFDVSRFLPLQSWALILINALIPAFLILIASVSFWLVTQSLLRPNNSFKPNPHQGGA